MNAKEYCESVDRQAALHKKREKDFPIFENGSPLCSLKETDFQLIYEPSLMQDYRYFVREELLSKVQRISEKLHRDSKTLVIRSAWRSFDHQRILWERTVKRMQLKFPSKPLYDIHEIASYFMARPKKSTHATGGAIDALVWDNKTNQVLDFGTNDGFNIDLNEKCYPYHPEISQLAKDNRALLIGLFEEEDFVCDLKEYWHFDYGNIGWGIENKRHAFFGIIEDCDESA